MTRPKLILDAGILCLLAVGSTSRTYIARHKVLRNNRTESHFDILAETVAGAQEIVAVPHALAEASNLARQIGGPAKTEITELLGRLILAMTERAVESRSVVERREYSRLGLTDCILLALVDDPSLTLLTEDANLQIAALTAGRQALHFNHILSQRGVA